MDAGGTEGDDILLERLRKAASGDAAVRQLRRRYDSLREDYERLLDRLGDLEERLVEPEAQRAPAERLPVSAAPTSVSEALAVPLRRLRDEYVSAADDIQQIVDGLEKLALGGMKGQHRAAEPAPAPLPREAGEPAPAPPRKVHVDVHGQGFGELLDFQERLSALPGVSRVSINAIDADRATLVVELDHGSQES